MIKGNAEARRYMRKVRSWLPGSGKLRKDIASQIESTVLDFLAENPEADFAALVNRFGAPQQIAAAYVEEMDTADLIRDLRIRKKILGIIIAASAAIVILWMGVVAAAYVKHQSSMNGNYDIYIEDGMNVPLENGGE